MIANNGLAGDSGFDRKGFRYGIEAAKELGLPITIAGHPNNEKFFEVHKDLLEYEKLTLKLTNPTDDETRELYQTHTIFLHPSMLEAGHPNLTLCEAASACIPIVGTYRGSKHFPGMWVLPSISVKEVARGIAETINTYEHRRQEMLAVRDYYSWDLVAKTLHKYYENVLKINESSLLSSSGKSTKIAMRAGPASFNTNGVGKYTFTESPCANCLVTNALTFGPLLIE
jgi:glycosyltransferase involved in cell wall biosynthesis